MNTWLPVIAALAGATVGGAITIFVTWLSARGQLKLTAVRLAEDRAMWAANRRLDQLNEFHQAVELLGIATQNYRIGTAWRQRAVEGEVVPRWVADLGDTRGAFEGAMRTAQLKVSLIDDDLLAEFAKLSDIYWSQVMIGDDPVAGMVTIERAVEAYRKRIAERYRLATSARMQGDDVFRASKDPTLSE